MKFITKIKINKLGKEIAEVETKLLNTPTREDFVKYTQLIEKRNELENLLK